MRRLVVKHQFVSAQTHLEELRLPVKIFVLPQTSKCLNAVSNGGQWLAGLVGGMNVKHDECDPALLCGNLLQAVLREPDSNLQIFLVEEVFSALKPLTTGGLTDLPSDQFSFITHRLRTSLCCQTFC